MVNNKKKIPFINILLGVVGVLLASVFVITLFTPAAQQRKDADAQAALEKKHRQGQVIGYARHIKKGLRDPDSLKFIQALSTPDGVTVCLLYRARNGYGGMDAAGQVFVDRRPVTSVDAWPDHCERPDMVDETAIANLIT